MVRSSLRRRGTRDPPTTRTSRRACCQHRPATSPATALGQARARSTRPGVRSPTQVERWPPAFGRSHSLASVPRRRHERHTPHAAELRFGVDVHARSHNDREDSRCSLPPHVQSRETDPQGKNPSKSPLTVYSANPSSTRGFRTRTKDLRRNTWEQRWRSRSPRVLAPCPEIGRATAESSHKLAVGSGPS